MVDAISSNDEENFQGKVSFEYIQESTTAAREEVSQ